MLGAYTVRHPCGDHHVHTWRYRFLRNDAQRINPFRSYVRSSVQNAFILDRYRPNGFHHHRCSHGCLRSYDTHSRIFNHRCYQNTVYRAWGSRVGGRISCAVFMGITYILQLAWVLMFIFLVITTFVYTTFWQMCANPRVSTRQDCIDFTQFYFFFPEGHPQEDMKVCGDQDIKLFCKDYVEKAEIMFILATVSCILIILSLIHYLMCLAANYAHIRDHEKLQEIQDLHLLTDVAGFDKNRF